VLGFLKGKGGMKTVVRAGTNSSSAFLSIQFDTWSSLGGLSGGAV
jgi:hypothetical protein